MEYLYPTTISGADDKDAAPFFWFGLLNKSGRQNMARIFAQLLPLELSKCWYMVTALLSCLWRRQDLNKRKILYDWLGFDDHSGIRTL